MNSTPLVWSISCCRHVASRPDASISCALPSRSRYLTLTCGRPLDLLVIFRDRQAAFFVFRSLFRLPDDLRIDEHLGLVIILLLRQIHGDDALGDADLDRRKPDAGRVVHGLEQVIDQLADSRSRRA